MKWRNAERLRAELKVLAERQRTVFTPKKMYIEDLEPTRAVLGDELHDLALKYAEPDPSVPMIFNPFCDSSGALELLSLSGNRYWFWTLLVTALNRNASLPLTRESVRDAALGLTVGWSVHYRTASAIYESPNARSAMAALKRLFKGHGLLLAISQGYVLIHDELMADSDGKHSQLNPLFNAWFAGRPT